MRIGGEQKEQEVVVSPKDGEEIIEKWVEWFRSELVKALKAGDDVEILIGRKPAEMNNYVK